MEKLLYHTIHNPGLEICEQLILPTVEESCTHLVCSLRRPLFDQNYSNIVKYYYNLE